MRATSPAARLWLGAVVLGLGMLGGCAQQPSVVKPAPSVSVAKPVSTPPTQDVTAQVNLARSLESQGQTEQAEVQYRQILAISPGHAKASNDLALLLQARGQFREAAKVLESGLRAHTGEAVLHYNLGVLNELYLLDLQAALEHYKAYQSQQEPADEQVAAWIVDIERRLASSR
ncbi:MAG: tetratricopeptide repeat protein [Gammaproteobacteria bacterium]|nr:tetratricopeptide repeat protein [Gammaproteobacteria bacterium]